MTVKYTVVPKVNPQNPEAPRKYYPMVKSTGKTNLRQLAERIAEISTVSSVDVVAVLEAFLNIVPRELAEGNIVKLGDFGSFSLRIRSQGADSEEQVTAHNITKTLTSFRPGKRFKETLDNVSYEKM
ncbi:MAG: HU family DNA-binding protein [Chloroflexota bacterium]|nr:HU family DNA-binding protein [Chloroflexota bacterium]